MVQVALEMLSDEDSVNALIVLYESDQNIFNTRKTPVSLRIISERIKADRSETSEVLKKLSESDFVTLERKAQRKFYSITASGIEFVEEKIFSE